MIDRRLSQIEGVSNDQELGVHEVLTKARQYIYDQARDMARPAEEVKCVWTWNGITHVLAEDREKTYKYQVRSVLDVLAIAKKHSRKAFFKEDDSKDSSDSDAD